MLRQDVSRIVTQIVLLDLFTCSRWNLQRERGTKVPTLVLYNIRKFARKEVWEIVEKDIHAVERLNVPQEVRPNVLPVLPRDVPKVTRPSLHNLTAKQYLCLPQSLRPRR